MPLKYYFTLESAPIQRDMYSDNIDNSELHSKTIARVKGFCKLFNISQPEYDFHESLEVGEDLIKLGIRHIFCTFTFSIIPTPIEISFIPLAVRVFATNHLYKIINEEVKIIDQNE